MRFAHFAVNPLGKRLRKRAEAEVIHMTDDSQNAQEAG